MLISEAQERGEIHKLLPQTHSPGVDYSLFIMETVEALLGEMETMPAALRRSFPPPICRSRSLFRGFRSEEHTSELQSHYSISYAVFCLPEFSPPICKSRSLFRCFSVYGRLLAVYIGGDIFIVGVRSRRSHGKKDRRQQSHEAPEGGPHTAKESGHVGHRALLACFLRSQVFFLHKIDLVNF